MPDAIVKVRDITKIFYGVKALNSVSFDIRPGEIIGLLGANGAGKSTLLKIIGGIQAADSGGIVFDNESLSVKNPFEAQCKGIITVHQELNLFLNMTAAENLFIGRELKNKRGLIQWKKTYKEAQNILDTMGLDIAAETIVGDLSVARRHLIEIARALNEKPKILLLDEPTASLSEDQISWLFERIHELVDQGTTVVYVSHRLDEVIRLCERCVVLRDGSLSGILDYGFTKEDIIKKMIGHKVSLEKKIETRELSDIFFECENLCLKNRLHNISFNLNRGEILGVAGLVGAGRTELMRALFGVDRMTQGKLVLNGQTLKIKHPADAIKNGLVLISEDRKTEGLFISEPVKPNLAITTIDKRAKFGVIDRKSETEQTTKISSKVSFDQNRIGSVVRTLSGGNQQKIVIGKSLLADADVLLMDEPTRGVDVGAREEIYDIIRELAGQGKGVILASSDWEELIALCDRVVVMSEGHITKELSGEKITEENIMHFSTVAKVAKEHKKEEDNIFEKIFKNNTSTLAIVLPILVLCGFLFSPTFRKVGNLKNLAWQSAVYIMMMLGQLLVIVSGGIDLSVGATMTVSGVAFITVLNSGNNMFFPALLAMLAVGIAIGAVNGALTVWGKMNAFIVTLGMSIVLQGAALIITPKPISPVPQIFKYISNKEFLGVPIILFVVVAMVLLFASFLRYKPTGRRLFAVGENPTGALWSGLPVESTKFTAYLICSLVAVVCSVYMLGRSGAAEPAVDSRFTLDSIEYTLIGGATLAGGKGSISGSLLAVLSMTILLNILNQSGVGIYFQEIVRGGLLLAIILSYERKMRRGKV